MVAETNIRFSQALLDCHDLVIIGLGGAAWRAIQGIGENRTPWAGDIQRVCLLRMDRRADPDH